MRSFVATLLVLLLLTPTGARANPKGGKIVRGSGSISQGVGRVDIHQVSKSATLTWDSFDIAPGEITQFHQPGKDAVAINRIFSGDASQILGSLQANGHVYLINPHGILFGRDAQVNVHALIATTTVDGSDLAGQGGYDVSAQAVPGAQVVNKGTITSGTGGFVYLVAPFARNGRDGVITSPEGHVMIEGGATVYLTDRVDGRGFALEYSVPPGGRAVNLGKIFADGGFARLRGELVAQGGLVQANAIRENGGVIELVADRELTLTAGSVTRAAGGAEAGSHAGTVYAWADGTSRVEEGAVVDVSAKGDGADGGFAEVSARKTVAVAGTFKAGAGAGGEKGEVLFDPETIVIGGDTRFAGAGKVTLAADREIAVAEGARIDLAMQPGARGASQTIEIRSGGDVVFERDALIEDSGTGRVWNVDIAAGRQGDGSRSAGGGDLVFEGGAGSGLRLARGSVRGVAAGDVVLADGASMSSVSGDVDVIAGGDVIFDAGRTPGVDTTIESGSGNVRVVAEGSVLLQRTPGSGGNAAIRTRGVYGTDGGGNVTKTDGGSVLVWAKHGDVDAGVGNRWLEPGPSFQGNGPERVRFGYPPGPDFDPIPVVDSRNQGTNSEGNRDGSEGILGIGTEAGGDVVVLAGGNVTSRATALARDGGTASGTGTTYSGAHIGAFGVPVVYQTDPALAYSGAVALPGATENRVIVLAGGDVSGDYVVRNGEATLLAGYELPADVDEVAELASLGLDAPGSVRRDALRRELSVSAIASDRSRGWVGTLARPVTVDLIEGSVDLLGRNGVAVRAIENPSLVYPFAEGGGGTAKAPTYAPDSFALVESEAGDVVLIGNEADLPTATRGRAINPLVWLMPPSLTIRTGDEGARPGDLVQLEDFTLFPSRSGGLTLDLAGKARTANGVSSGSAVVTITGSTSGAAADLSFVIPSGTRLRDPETGLLYEVQTPIAFGPRAAAEPASVRVTFEALPGREGEELVIPASTRVVDYRGNVFETRAPQAIPALAQRVSTGEVRFVPSGGAASEPIQIPAGTLMRTAGGALFEVVGGANLNPGDRAVTVPVRALATQAGVDARAGELQLVTPIAGIANATNRQATRRPATAEITFFAVEPGAADRTDFGRIKGLLAPVPGVRFAYAERPAPGGGNDQGTNGLLQSQANARAVVIGPVGNISGERALELVDASILPRGVSAAQIQLFASGTERPAALVPAIAKRPAGDGRPDFPGDRINAVDPQSVWQRVSGGGSATIRQSDADPGFDARNLEKSFDYATYYAQCRSGAACGLSDPLAVDAIPLRRGNGPTHRGDRTAASLVARLGFERIGFELAEAATLRAGPADGEEATGARADIVDVTLTTQHANAADRTMVLAPFGDISFAAEQREVRDQATGLTTTVPGNALSGVTVAGPGSLLVAAGVAVARNGAIGAPTGVGGLLALSATAIGNASARGIETIGNLVNAALPVGGSRIEIVTAGNVELNDRGAIDTLQGGDILIRSLGGSVIGGEPDPTFTAKRGIFTMFVPQAGANQQAAASGGGSIRVEVAESFDIGKSVAAALSGGDITLIAERGSVSAGSAEPFRILGVSSSPTSSLPQVDYEGGGIFAARGRVTIDAGEDVDIGAGITGAAIAIAAGGNINAGQGAITSSGNVSIDAGGSISGSIQASGAISIGSGTVTQSASLSAGGLVTGAGSAGSNTGAGKVDAGTAVSADRAGDVAAGGAAVEGGHSRRSGVSIDVTSRPTTGRDCEPGDESCDEG